MSRELQIIDALAELSLDRHEVDLESIQATVQRRQDQGRLLPETWKQVARQALRTLAGLGMVQIDSDESSRLRFNKVKLTEQFLNTDAVKAAHMARQEARDREDDRKVNSNPDSQLSSEEAPNNEGGGGRRGNDGSGFDDGDSGGAGFREVLAHPYLFSLSEADFEDILGRI